MRISNKITIQLLLVLGLFSITTFGQNTNNLKVDLPNFTPPTPEAFAITKYGDVPVDEFNGKVNLSIPIYQYQVGKLTLPISLNYNGAGVKVNDIATQTGINWTLDAGGVISREIRDIADEEALFNNRRVNITNQQLYYLNQADCSSGAGQIRTYVDQDYDTEVDVFRFHFANYSGSFYLDNNFIPVMVKNEQHLKIEIVGSLYADKTFVITDPNGIKYYFGGATAAESTRSRVGNQNQLNAGGVTSFYLYKIEHPVNGTILLEYYINPNIYQIPLSNNYSTTRMTGKGEDPMGCAIPLPDSHNHSVMMNSVYYNKLIKRIYNPDNSDVVLFNRTAIDNLNFKTVLNSVEIKKNNTLYSKVDLEYSGLESPTTAKRFFLTKVSFNKDFQSSGGSGQKYEVYKMDYNDPDALPSRTSWDIDILGYYNYAPQNPPFYPHNTTLSPCFPGEYASSNCPNRNAYFPSASKGVLKKITYPTGGYTNFEYEEQPSYEKKYEPIGGDVFLNVFDGPEDTTAESHNHDEAPRTYLDEDNVQHTLFEMPILFTQTVNINLSSTTENNDVLHHYAAVTLTITNLSLATNAFGRVTIKHCNNGSLVFPYEFLKDNVYKIEIDIVPPQAHSARYSSYGSFNFDLWTGYNSIPGAGVRIKSIKDFTKTNTTAASSKRYFYTAYHKRNDLFADIFSYNPKISLGGYIKQCLDPGSPLEQGTTFTAIDVPVYNKTISSDYYYSDFSYATFQPKEYTNVTVSYGGDNFEQGGIEKTFKVSEESMYSVIDPITPSEYDIAPSIPDAKTNTLSLDGLELKEKTFKNINGSVFKIQEKTFEYEYPVIDSKLNFFGFRKYIPSPNGYHNVTFLASLDITNYLHHDPNDELNPDPFNSCNCHPDGIIQAFMNQKMFEKLTADSNPIANTLYQGLNSGLYAIGYIFLNNYESVRVFLWERSPLCDYNTNTLSNYFIGAYPINSYSYKKTNEKETNYIDPVPASIVAHEVSELDDPETVYPTQDQLEASYKKISTELSYEYGTLKGLPTKITASTSDSAINNVVVNTYANQVNTLTGPTVSTTSPQGLAYAKLVDINNIATPIEVSQELSESGNTTLLTKQRTLYKQSLTNANVVLPAVIQTAKGSQALEDRVVFEEYDAKGNPTLFSYKDGTKSKYLYNANNQVYLKIENFTGTLDPNVNPLTSTPCAFMSLYPNARVTIYTYDPVTNQVVQTMDSNCRKTTYVYDVFHRLKQIKDHDGNIIKEFDNNYKPQ